MPINPTSGEGSSEADDPEEILRRMDLEFETALLALSEDDPNRLESALAECDRLIERADPLLATLHSAPDGSGAEVRAQRVRLLDAALQLQDVNGRLISAIELLRNDVSQDLKLLDGAPIVLSAYGQSDSKPRRKIDLVR